METEHLKLQVCCCCRKTTPTSLGSGLTCVISTLGIIYVTHGLLWAQFSVPIIFTATLPLVLMYKIYQFWKRPSINDDLAVFMNIAVLAFLWTGYDAWTYLILFSLANGPVLLGTVVTADSLIYYNPDAMTSIYLHIAPALIMFSVHWYSPYSYWPFQWWDDDRVALMNLPNYSLKVCYGYPMGIIILHMLLFWFFTKLVIEKKWESVQIYSILQTEEFIQEQKKSSKIPWDCMWSYFGMKISEGMIFLLLPALIYSSYKTYCFTLFVLFVVVTWKGGTSVCSYRPG